MRRCPLVRGSSNRSRGSRLRAARMGVGGATGMAVHQHLAVASRNRQGRIPVVMGWAGPCAVAADATGPLDEAGTDLVVGTHCIRSQAAVSACIAGVSPPTSGCQTLVSAL